MIFLAFLLPLGIYLFILGAINRQRHPVMVTGVTDFIGILFAASGFLLFAGPSILSGLSERWRLFWLLGHRPGRGAESFWEVWIFFSVLYYFVVVGVAALVLRSYRHLTSIYNTEPGLVEQCLGQVFTHLGLDPSRSGSMFIFGVEPVVQLAPAGGGAIQLAMGEKAVSMGRPSLPPATILEIEVYSRMRHITLRWDPADSMLRREVEGELHKRLSQIYVEPSELGLWLKMIGLTLFGTSVIAGLTLTAIRLAGLV